MYEIVLKLSKKDEIVSLKKELHMSAEKTFKICARILSALLCAAMLFPAAFGCVPAPGDKDAHGSSHLPAGEPVTVPTQGGASGASEEATEILTPVPAITAGPTDTPVVTEEPTPEPTPAPTNIPVPTAQPTPAPTKTPKPTAKPTPAPTKTPKPTAKPTATPKPGAYTEPPHHPQAEHDSVPRLISKSGKYKFYQDGLNLFKVDNRAFEMSFYIDSAAKKYAELVNYTADHLSGKTNVYSLIIPMNYGVVLFDDIREQISGYVDTEAKINTVLSYMSGKVKKVKCCHDLLLHRDEYVYFRTDHHWTALGAYYAYRAFCRTKGVSHYKLTDHREKAFHGFLGSSYKQSGKDPDLLPGETVYAYYPMADVEMLIHDSSGVTYTAPIIANVASYMCFAGGDNPLTVFTNPAVSSGTLIIIKESFGNALLPFLVDHYHKVYEIDYRYWKGNVIELANQIGATDLIFANNFAIVSSTSKIGQIAKIVK